MEVVVILFVCATAVGVIVLNRRGQIEPFLERLKSGFTQLTANLDQPATYAPAASASSDLDKGGNVPVIISEVRKPPLATDRHGFPDAGPPATRFEDFNRKLLILELTERPEPWPATSTNDYPTVLRGPLDWCQAEVRRRLRPFYPVVVDQLGWWADTSAKLEMHPDYTDAVASAYLALDVTRRPVVVSVKGIPVAERPKGLTLLRYQFADYELETRFLGTHPTDLLQLLLTVLSDTPERWHAFSPARLRKTVFDRYRAVSEQQHKLQAELTRNLEKNRFASLWSLKDEKPIIEGEALGGSQTTGARN